MSKTLKCRCCGRLDANSCPCWKRIHADPRGGSVDDRGTVQMDAATLIQTLAPALRAGYYVIDGPEAE